MLARRSRHGSDRSVVSCDGRGHVSSCSDVLCDRRVHVRGPAPGAAAVDDAITYDTVDAIEVRADQISLVVLQGRVRDARCVRAAGHARARLRAVGM